MATCGWASGNYSINTKVVPPEQEPKKFTDFLDPFWKGKICMWDPITTAIPEYSFWRPRRSYRYADWYHDLFYDLSNKSAGRMSFALFGSPNPIFTGECALYPDYSGVTSGTIKGHRTVDKVTWTKAGT